MREAQEGFTTMKVVAEATTTEHAAAVAAPGAAVAPVKAASKKATTTKKAAPKGKKAAKGTKKVASKPRAETKGAKILDMIARPKGATLAEIMKATSGQAHSLRGLLSTAGKKRGLKIESTKNEAGDRVYRTGK
jgi:hypothetical protein